MRVTRADALFRARSPRAHARRLPSFSSARTRGSRCLTSPTFKTRATLPTEAAAQGARGPHLRGQPRATSTWTKWSLGSLRVGSRAPHSEYSRASGLSACARLSTCSSKGRSKYGDCHYYYDDGALSWCMVGLPSGPSCTRTPLPRSSLSSSAACSASRPCRRSCATGETSHTFLTPHNAHSRAIGAASSTRV